MRDRTQSALEEHLNQFRMFLKDTIRKSIDFSQTDQSQGFEVPLIEKPYALDSRRIDLSKPGEWNIPPKDLKDAILNRRSHRNYTKEPLTIEEISFLLWATQGIREPIRSGQAFRTVPSAGCRHTFETYTAVMNVENLDSGIYRYLPTTHQLLFEFSVENLNTQIVKATLGQSFCGTAAAVFIWTSIPYRMEWRYSLAAHKVIALDAGHVCQNLYLACEAISAGTCAIAAYDQELLDDFLRVDGDNEFAIYLAPVGKVKS